MNDLGLSPQEAIVMDHLVAAYNDFVSLPRQHASEVEEFAAALHRMQDLLAVRIVQRSYPGWNNTIGHGVHDNG